MTNYEKIKKLMDKIRKQPINTMKELKEYGRLFDKYILLSKKVYKTVSIYYQPPAEVNGH